MLGPRLGEPGVPGLLPVVPLPLLAGRSLLEDLVLPRAPGIVGGSGRGAMGSMRLLSVGFGGGRPRDKSPLSMPSGIGGGAGAFRLGGCGEASRLENSGDVDLRFARVFSIARPKFEVGFDIGLDSLPLDAGRESGPLGLGPLDAWTNA